MNAPHYFEIAGHLAAAWFAGSLIGAERSFHGRPAGFRTHALVCLASALLMLITAYQQDWFPVVVSDTVRMDPQRMAQGIMTGIGFLGAGVIFKEGLSVRGLTTAASIWITAAIGILYGVGFFYPALLATLATIGTLALFRWIEEKMPSQHYALHVLRFPRGRTQPEAEMRKFITDHGFSIANMSYRLDEDGKVFEYRMSIRTTDPTNIPRLVQDYCKREDILEFRISPTGD
ncbi:MAG: MgtC/SapB family protein [Bradyrhizobiaceae bacterium]|nr:MgtC/SapB family protein [Bradyrhizobiaceae bacterium]